jgi:hypothetical protein
MCEDIVELCSKLKKFTAAIYLNESEFKERFHIYGTHEVDYVSFSTSSVVLLLVTDLNEYHRKYINLDSFQEWYDSL